MAKSLPRKTFWDKAIKYELKAAAYAALGDYENAVDEQEDALSEARSMNVDVSDIRSRLAFYEKRQKWF